MVIFLPIPTSGTGYWVLFGAGFHPNPIPLFCPGGTHTWDCRPPPFPGRMHVLAHCWGSCVWVVFVPVPGTHWGGSQHHLGPYSVVAVVAVATSAAALGALTLGASGARLRKFLWDQDQLLQLDVSELTFPFTWDF